MSSRVKASHGKYEEYAHVLDYNPRGRSTTVRGRDGIMITTVGENYLTLLEVVGVPNSTFKIGERIYIGKDERTKVTTVLGKMLYDRISSLAQDQLPAIVKNIVTSNESKFVEYLNNAQALTYNHHTLEAIPGIAKTCMKLILLEREKKRFESYQDLEERGSFKDPITHISERIMTEITGKSRFNIFVKK